MRTVQFFIYVLQNQEGRLYIGLTTDLQRHIQQHQQEEGGWTRGKGHWKLVYHETFSDRAEAMKRERNLKRGKTNRELRARLKKEKL